MRSFFLVISIALLIGRSWTFKLNRVTILSSRLLDFNNGFSFQSDRADLQIRRKVFISSSKIPVKRSSLSLSSSTDTNSEVESGFDASAWLNPNTRGGVLVWCGLLTLVPVGVYQYFISTGLEPTTVGAYVGALFVLLSNLLWASTYVFRVANKDMTYAKQLRDYENAVLQKRLEELADDEINALMEEIEIEEEGKSTTTTTTDKANSLTSTTASSIANNKE